MLLALLVASISDISMIQWPCSFKNTRSSSSFFRSSAVSYTHLDVYKRQEEVHDQQGVGIGLYLAREIVTQQGGYIKVVSAPGNGAEFSIMLPIR